jgi:hypothetical protein
MRNISLDTASNILHDAIMKNDQMPMRPRPNPPARIADRGGLMPARRRLARHPASLTVKLGRWFEARATGWGVAALCALAALALAAAANHLIGL